MNSAKVATGAMEENIYMNLCLLPRGKEKMLINTVQSAAIQQEAELKAQECCLRTFYELQWLQLQSVSQPHLKLQEGNFYDPRKIS